MVEHKNNNATSQMSIFSTRNAPSKVETRSGFRFSGLGWSSGEIIVNSLRTVTQKFSKSLFKSRLTVSDSSSQTRSCFEVLHRHRYLQWSIQIYSVSEKPTTSQVSFTFNDRPFIYSEKRKIYTLWRDSRVTFVYGEHQRIGNFSCTHVTQVANVGCGSWLNHWNYTRQFTSSYWAAAALSQFSGGSGIKVW